MQKKEKKRSVYSKREFYSPCEVQVQAMEWWPAIVKMVSGVTQGRARGGRAREKKRDEAGKSKQKQGRDPALLAHCKRVVMRSGTGRVKESLRTGGNVLIIFTNSS